MKLSRALRILVTTAVVFSSFSLAFATQPTWARKARAFPSECEIGSSASPSGDSSRGALQSLAGVAACKPIRIPSPDKRLAVEVKYQKLEIEKGYEILSAYFLLRGENGTTREGVFPAGFQDIDLLWSPDSKGFFVNGGNGGGYWGFWVYVYRIDDPKLEPLDIAGQAQLDMVRTFPPCKASGIDRKICLELEKAPDSNMTGIDWAGGSSTLVVMAEVPCSGGHGGIMCQVMGYELEIPTGRIVRRMKAKEFATNWQKSMAFRFHVPDPPEYCDPTNRRKVFGCAGHNW
jgi:hypothetical protein